MNIKNRQFYWFFYDFEVRQIF